MSVNNRSSKYNPAKEKDTARIICIGIPVILFTLLILAIALPSMYEKYSGKDEKEAIRRLEHLSKNIDKYIATSLSEKESTDNADLPETISDDIRTKETQNSAGTKFIPGKGDTLTLVYTVQVGSFDDLESAIRLYDSIINDFTTADLAYLRIEKVGQYYAVRIGQFGERTHAEIFHEKIRLYLSTAIMMQAYIKKERIKKLHSS